MNKQRSLVVACCLATLISWAKTPQCQYRVVGSYQHNPKLFTQGLYWQPGRLLESSGGYGGSKLVDNQWPEMIETRAARLPDDLYGEDITIVDGKVYQLTWKTGQVRIYKDSNFELLNTIDYGGVGWGLTHTKEFFIRSDGFYCLFYHDKETFRQIKERCIDQKRQLNAIAYMDGVIYANHFPTDEMVRIDESSGKVLDMLDLSKLSSGKDAVMANGVAAYKDGQIIVTGKQWDKIYVLDVSQCLQPSQVAR